MDSSSDGNGTSSTSSSTKCYHSSDRRSTGTSTNSGYEHVLLQHLRESQWALLISCVECVWCWKSHNERLRRIPLFNEQKRWSASSRHLQSDHILSEAWRIQRKGHRTAQHGSTPTRRRSKYELVDASLQRIKNQYFGQGALIPVCQILTYLDAVSHQLWDERH